MSNDEYMKQKIENQDINKGDSREIPVEGSESNASDPVNMSAQPNGDDITTEGNDSDAQDETALWKDKYMRLSAEFDNYRKRTLKEKMDLIASGGKDVISDLLPILDDMDRALEASKSVEDIESVRMGSELIAHKLKSILNGKGLKEIDAAGKELDTDFHEAVAKIPAPDKRSRGRIVDVIQKGYTLKDNVIRHAKVVVGE